MDLFDESVSSLSPNSTSYYTHPIIQFVSSTFLLGSVTLQYILGIHSKTRFKGALDKFIDAETPIALENLLCNIGPDGCNAIGVAPGVVIASPDVEDPDYFYTWTRDSSLVFKTLIDRLGNEYDADLQKHIQNFIITQAKLQGVSNPSGGLSDGDGLGEPKFHVDLGTYNEEWGRPQRDGPALRAIALISYAKWLLKNGYASAATDIVWPIARNDLNYVAQYWNQTGFDLWEEVNGSSFFTIANSYRALIEGTTLAKALGTPEHSYETVAPQILCFLQSFWTSSGYIDANINVNNGRTGKDTNTVLASIHIFDPSLGCDATTFQPCSDRALANLKQVVDSFSIYDINRGTPEGFGIAVGRYSEDVYFGGNPWYLTTLAVAEQIYDSLIVWEKEQSLTVTQTSLPFFQSLLGSDEISVGTHHKHCSDTFSTVVAKVSAYADSFLSIVEKYAGLDGSLAEQFSRDDGDPLSAGDLTWSYAAFLSATARRAGIVPPSWAEEDVVKVPASCHGTFARGSYSSVSPPSFPASQTPKTGAGTGTGTGTTSKCAAATTVAVTFEEIVETKYGDTVKIVGNVDVLGSWDTGRAVALDASRYTAVNPLWEVTIPLKACQNVEYKFIIVNMDGSITWERDPNHSYTVPRTCAANATHSGKWQG